jgi:hypothetical protein
MKQKLYKIRMISCLATILLLFNQSVLSQTHVPPPPSAKAIEQLTVYPNPIADKIQITGLPENSIVHIVNVLGIQVLEIRPASGREEVDMSKFSEGIYFLKAFDADGNYEVRRLVKE